MFSRKHTGSNVEMNNEDLARKMVATTIEERIKQRGKYCAVLEVGRDPLRPRLSLEALQKKVIARPDDVVTLGVEAVHRTIILETVQEIANLRSNVRQVLGGNNQS